MSDAPHKCDDCGAKFYYEPRHHRCPGEWEQLTGPISNPYAGLSWVEEQMRKQGTDGVQG